MLIIQLDGGVNSVSQRLHISMEQMGIDCVIGISTLFIPFLCLALVDSPNELSPMIDFHISGMPTLTKH